MYLSTIALDTIFRKLVSSCEATALARRVLPVPGGPYSRHPLGGDIPEIGEISLNHSIVPNETLMLQ